MKNKIIFVVVVALLTIGGIWYLVSNREQAKPLETTKVKIAGLPIVQGLPLYLAIEKGYFKEAGLEVDYTKFEAPNQIIDAIISGQVDFTSPSGAMGIAGVADFKNPDKLKIYAAAGGNDVVPNDAILVKNDSNLKSIQELKGKKLGILPGIQWRTIAKHILAQNNLVADQDVTLVELAAGLQGQALASGQIDALLGVEPTPTIVKAKNIGKEIVHTPTVQYVANPFYGGAGIIRADFAKQNPNTTAKVLEILVRAVKEINNNPNTARQYLKGYTPLEENQISQVPISLFKMYNNFNQNDIDAVQKLYDIFSTYKVIDGKIDFQKIIYSPDLK